MSRKKPWRVVRDDGKVLEYPFEFDARNHAAMLKNVREILAPGEPTRAEILAERDEARAEVLRFQRVCDEALPREYLECPACGMQHIEGPRHDNPAVDGRKRPHHTHRCYGCGHVWDTSRWSFGADVPKPERPPWEHQTWRVEHGPEGARVTEWFLVARRGMAWQATQPHSDPGFYWGATPREAVEGWATLAGWTAPVATKAPTAGAL